MTKQQDIFRSWLQAVLRSEHCRLYPWRETTRLCDRILKASWASAPASTTMMRTMRRALSSTERTTIVFQRRGRLSLRLTLEVLLSPLSAVVFYVDGRLVDPRRYPCKETNERTAASTRERSGFAGPDGRGKLSIDSLKIHCKSRSCSVL